MCATSARHEISNLFHSGKIVGKTPLGDTIVVSGERPEIRLVVKDGDVCVTILPPENQLVGQEDYQQEVNENIKQCEERIEAIRLEREAIAAEKQIVLLQFEQRRNLLSKEENNLGSRIASLKQNYYQSLLPVHRNRN